MPDIYSRPIMYTERRIERHQLPYYLKVYNRHTGRAMGYMGNISDVGLMLISELPLLVGPVFELQVKIPSVEGEPKLIDLSAHCLWCKEDATPGHYDSGFELQGPAPTEFLKLVDALRHYFTFHPQGSSA